MGMAPTNGLEQAGFRGRFDDGVESLQESDGGATWIAALNTDWEQTPDVPFRMRILVNHPNQPLGFSGFLHMKFSYNGGPFSRPITKTSSIVRLLDTTFWENRDHSTDFVGRLGNGSWDPFNIALIDDEPETFVLASLANQQKEIETEWNLEIVGEDVSPGDTVEFRCFRYNSVLFTRGYIFTPRLTVPDPELAEQMKGTIAVESVLTAESEATAMQALASAVEPILITKTETEQVLTAETETEQVLTAETETEQVLKVRRTEATVTPALIAEVDI